jgi:hypothetical protein
MAVTFLINCASIRRTNMKLIFTTALRRFLRANVLDLLCESSSKQANHDRNSTRHLAMLSGG